MALAFFSCHTCVFVRLRSSLARGTSRRRLACTLAQRIVAPYLRRLSYPSLIKIKYLFRYIFFCFLSGSPLRKGKKDQRIGVCGWGRGGRVYE